MMCKQLFIIVILTCLLSLTMSCSNSPDCDLQQTTDPSVQGRWKLIMTSGGIAGITKYPEPDELTEIEFTANGRYHRYMNHVAVGSAKYTTQYEETIFGSEKRLVIRYEYAPEGLVASRYGDTLMLYDNYVDGFSYSYTKSQ